MGLFDKKFCDICGEKIGFLGNRKLEDGNLCKDCAKKLSPWFSDRRRSTVNEIKEQLDYREENKAAVSAFNTTKALGISTKVLLDEDAGKFMVTSARNTADANPDVISFSQVTGCRIDVDESKSELTHSNSEGKEVSYFPPRYTYDYDFYVVININSPYFDEIRFQLNNNAIEAKFPIGGNAVGGVIPVEYEECRKLGEEIKDALTQARENVRQAAAEAAAPKLAVTCSHCLATVLPDENGCCKYCGGVING